MAAYRRVDDLTVTCRLTACTPGSAPGPTLGVEYGKPLPLPFTSDSTTLIIPATRRFILGDRSLPAVAATATWNSLLTRLRDVTSPFYGRPME